MGQITDTSPALLLLPAFSRHDAALNWAKRRAEETCGPVTLESPVFEFTETDYYRKSMGGEIKKQFFAFERLIDPERLAEIKRTTNDWEIEYAELASHAEPRPLNLDPGYITLAKLVLASTKDHAHRIYLSGGIYAEVTLSYRARRWQHHPWTFPDYRRADYHEFFEQCREYLRKASKASPGR